MTKLLHLPDVLSDAGLAVRVLPRWDNVHIIRSSDYGWREPDGDPAGMMWHHTAGTQYTPNRDKANLWTGVGYHDTHRLTQENYGDGFPVVVVANAHPAPISSGYGVRAVLEQFVKQDIPFVGKQTLPDDDWAGNTHYINLENVLDGTGGKMDQGVWEMLPVIANAINGLMGWSPARHITHSHHTRRKIDMRDGRFPDANATMMALRSEMIDMTDCPWTDHTYPPCDSHFYPETDLVSRGTDAGENQGQCNVPSAQHAAIQWNFDTRRFIAGNQRRYDYATILTEGREAVFEYRSRTE